MACVFMAFGAIGGLSCKGCESPHVPECDRVDVCGLLCAGKPVPTIPDHCPQPVCLCRSRDAGITSNQQEHPSK